MTTQADYLEQLSPDNAAVLFIDNQTALTLGVQSIDMTVLKTNTEGLASLAGHAFAADRPDWTAARIISFLEIVRGKGKDA